MQTSEIHSGVEIVDSVGQPYRAKDITMAATVDTANRTVLITGAIDTNDRDILVRVELPETGIWRVIKAETNLTNEVWAAWQITLGEGTQILPEVEGGTNVCQQYKKLFIDESLERFCFYEGEVRPGEPVLKQFTLKTKIPRIVMSHNRAQPTFIETEEEQSAGEVPEAVVRGLMPKPYVESWLEARIV